MPRRHVVRIGLLASAPVLAVLLLFSFQWSAAAESPEMVWGDPHIALAVDTTASMGPALNALAGQIPGAWIPLTKPVQFHLAAFKDTAAYQGNTGSAQQLANWVNDLPVGGGGNCPDNAFAALRELAINTPEGQTPATHALLVTDATPQGRRTFYSYMVSRMLARGVEVNTLLSGWCAGAPIAPDLLAYLSIATGGDFFPTDAPNYDTDAAIALRVTAFEDTLLHQAGEVEIGKPIVVPLDLDSSLTTLGVEDPPTITCPPYCCLTCTMPVDVPVVTIQGEGGGVTVELLDPQGNPIGAGAPGYEIWESDNRRLQQYSDPSIWQMPGSFSIRVSGSGAYEVEVLAHSDVHMAAEWRRLNSPGRYFIRTALFADDPVGQALLESGPITCTFRIQPWNGQWAQPLDLFDDGEHRDGQAGDLVFGGVAQVNQFGLYQISVIGELSDGTRFQRLDPTILRVGPSHIPDPDSAQALPEQVRTVRYNLTNGGNPGGGPTTYDLQVISEMGWAITDTVPSSVTLMAGEEIEIEVDVVIPAGATPGMVEETTLVAAPTDALAESVAGVAQTTVVDQLRVYTPVIMRP